MKLAIAINIDILNIQYTNSSLLDIEHCYVKDCHAIRSCPFIFQ